MFEAVRAWLEKPRDPDIPERSKWDWLLVAVISVIHAAVPGESTSVVIALTAVVPFVIPWRRSHPLLASLGYAVPFCTAYVLNLGGEEAGTGLTGVIIAYALFRWASGRHAAFGIILMMATSALYQASYESDIDVVRKVVATVFWVLPAAIGLTVRYRADGRRLLVEESRLGERVQLARELHDTVAHHVSAIAIQAQAARVVAESKPDAATDALKVIEQTASRALAEMRKVVGALRTAEIDTAPQQRLSDIERLAKENQGRPRIEVNFSGPLDSLEPWEEVGLYRVAQESITNARRHARNASRITVRVDCTGDSICLTVVDDGENDQREPRGSGGHGLVGMEERVKLLGGQFEAGPSPEGGWLVRATLPRTGGP